MIMEPSEPLISVENQMGVHKVTILPARLIDPESISRIGWNLSELIDQGAVKIVVDFSNVLYLSSGTLGMLIQTKRLIEKKQGTMKLCAIKPLVLEIFQITRLGNVFSVYPTADEASASFD
jgi:anti-sigma B factor antagonist